MNEQNLKSVKYFWEVMLLKTFVQITQSSETRHSPPLPSLQHDEGNVQPIVSHGSRGESLL